MDWWGRRSRRCSTAGVRCEREGAGGAESGAPRFLSDVKRNGLLLLVLGLLAVSLAYGALITGVSEPADCTGHLSEHCVTGSVARCVPEAPSYRCDADLTCVFGDAWWSRGADTLVILGDCSDALPREIEIRLAADSSSNTQWGGAGGTLVSVGGDVAWSHDNWEWAFRKCPPGTDPSSCFQKATAPSIADDEAPHDHVRHLRDH